MRVFAVLAMVAAGVGAAAADRTDDRQIAKRLFTEGRVLVDQKKFIEACVLFEKSYQLDPAVGTRLNLAECAEREGKPRAAWLLWVSAADEFDRDGDERAAFARRRADALASKLATVEVHVTRPKTKGLTLRIGVREVAPAATVIERLEEGTITVTVTAPNREEFTKKVEVAVGEKVVVEVPKLARLVASTEPDEEEPAPKSKTGMWTGLAIGSGVLSAASVGLVFYFADRTETLEGKFRQANAIGDFEGAAQHQREGEAAARNANIGIGVAIGAGAVTTFCIYKALQSRHAKRPATSFVAPVVTPQVAGASLLLRW